MTDWYFTQDARKRGFTARPVVGGVFLQMLCDKAAWSKWAGRDRTKAAGWAPMPAAPHVTPVVATALNEPVPWRYTVKQPADGWMKPGFDAAGWKTGPAGFGTPMTPGAKVRTQWTGNAIWMRRQFDLADATGDLQLLVHHDEDAEIYVNGILAAQVSGYTTDYEPVALLPAARAALKAGQNLMAVHCRQTQGGQYIDVGIVRIAK